MLAVALLFSACAKFDSRAEWYNTATQFTSKTLYGEGMFDTEHKTAANKKVALEMLDGLWNVKDKETFEQRYSNLLAGFYNRNLYEANERISAMTEDERKAEASKFRRPERLMAYYEAVMLACKNGENSALAFDYVSAIDLAGLGYVAGYLDQAKAEEYANAAAIKLQAEFGSWDEMMQDYMFGHQYWNDDFPIENSDTANFIRQYKEYASGSRYNADWNMDLTVAK